VRPPTISSDELDEQLLAAALHSQKEELDDDDDCWDEDVYNYLQDHLSALGVSQ
jgi:hypothetical protein